MQQRRYFWKDLATGHVTVTAVNRCPPGHGPTERPGGSARVHVPFSAMDGANPMNDTATFDTAGPGILLRDAAASVTAALAAAPARTGELRDKAARAMMEVEGTSHDMAFGSALDTLHSLARRYKTFAFAASDAGEKAALETAAQSIAGYATAQLAMRQPGSGRAIGLDANPTDARAAQGDLRRTLSDGWKTGAR